MPDVAFLNGITLTVPDSPLGYRVFGGAEVSVGGRPAVHSGCLDTPNTYKSTPLTAGQNMLNDGYLDMCVAMVTRRGETFCGSQQSWKAYIVQLTVIWLKHENTLRSKTYLIIIAEILDFFQFYKL